jgi:putative transposase
MYRWRKLNDEERRQVLAWRLAMQRPLHSPHHLDSGRRQYLVTAACYEHMPHVGLSVERMNDFAQKWLHCLHQGGERILAWVILPNHYHALVESERILELLSDLGQLHGRTSFDWNGKEGQRGRKVWCNAVESAMKNVDHSHATLNYVHHNPVKHGYAAKWTDWPWSSAADYLEKVGRAEAERLWQKYPIESYGAGWDDETL